MPCTVMLYMPSITNPRWLTELYATVFVIVTMSSVGLPGTNGFIGEFMILSGAFLSEHLGAFGPIQATVGAVGVILAAVYMLHAVLKMFWGPLDKPQNEGLADLTSREALALAPLLILIFWIGLYPSPFLSRMQASVDTMAREYTAKLKVSDGEPKRRGMLERATLSASPRGQGGSALAALAAEPPAGVTLTARRPAQPEGATR